MSQRVETSAHALVLTRSCQPENGHLRRTWISYFNDPFCSYFICWLES